MHFQAKLQLDRSLSHLNVYLSGAEYFTFYVYVYVYVIVSAPLSFCTLVVTTNNFPVRTGMG